MSSMILKSSASIAALSEAIIYSAPIRSSSLLPMIKGLIPWGSLTATNPTLLIIIIIEYAPDNLDCILVTASKISSLEG